MHIDMFETRLSRKVEIPPLSFPFALRGRAVASRGAPQRLGSAPIVESLEYDAAVAHTHEWQGLAERALEPNVFAEPVFALAAAQHFAGAHRPRFLFAWAGNGLGDRGDLIAVCPMYVPGRFESRRLALSWTSDQAPLATPLIDAHRAEAALDAILVHERRDTPGAAGFVFRALPRHGATAALLQDLARDRALACELAASPLGPASHHTREPGSVLLAAPAEEIVATFGSRRGELEKAGAVSFRTLRHPSDVRHATEEFFALDAAACRDRTDAILTRTDVTTFVRALTRMLATIGKCRIDRLALDGRPIAMSIVIGGGNRDYVWKTATHPAHAKFGLEGQLVLAHVRADPTAPALALADHRREIPRHATVEDAPQIWTGSLPVVDVGLATAGNRSRGLAAAMHRRRTWQKVHAVFGRRR